MKEKAPPIGACKQNKQKPLLEQHPNQKFQTWDITKLTELWNRIENLYHRHSHKQLRLHLHVYNSNFKFKFVLWKGRMLFTELGCYYINALNHAQSRPQSMPAHRYTYTAKPKYLRLTKIAGAPTPWHILYISKYERAFI
jgi:hypothetical protein